MPINRRTAATSLSATALLALPHLLGIPKVSASSAPDGAQTPSPSKLSNGTPSGGGAAKIVDLGTLSEGASSIAHAINDHGQVVGEAGTSRGGLDVRAFLWDQEHGMRDLKGLANERPGSPSSATAINANGQVAGTIGALGFLWEQEGKLTLLPGKVSSSPRSINDQGLIAGRAQGCEHVHYRSRSSCESQLHAVLWQDHLPSDLGFPGEAVAATNEGSVVGWRTGSSGRQIIVWKPGSLQDVNLPSNVIHRYTINPMGINAVGQVVGSYQGTSRYEAFLWHEGTSYQLDTLYHGAQPSLRAGIHVRSINDHGQIVGWSWTDDNQQHACLWDGGTQIGQTGEIDPPDSIQPSDLNDLLPPDSGWTLTEARDINNRGQIVGKGIHDGQIRAFLLTLPALGTETAGYVRPQLRHERLPRMGSGPMTENPASPVWALTTGAVGVAAIAGLLLHWRQRADA